MRKSQFLTSDLQMQKVVQMAENVAASRATVLICGESGTGKEVLAKLIHDSSPRVARRMLAVNCAAIPRDLLESELFGYEKGAFTGASQAKPGKFELAHESTFLLDEISEMPLLLQAKLLRVIQEGEVERIGARSPQKINVRLIATTNRSLEQMVQLGTFRADLYYRLNVIPLRLPPLRDRPRDIHGLAKVFLSAANQVSRKEEKTLSENAMAKLQQWRWPGNVRELENVIERAVLLSVGSVIDACDLTIDGFEPRPENPGELVVGPGMTIDEAERQLIMKTLEHTMQNRSQAARLLGISVRTLRNKLQGYRQVEG